MIELEQQGKAYHLQQDEKEPIVVFQKEIQQISHQKQFLGCLINYNFIILSETKNLNTPH